MSGRILNLLAYLTGARGPLRSAFDWLRSKGIGERVIKSALAAVVAYWLARFLPGNPNPVLAPLTAIFSINLTIAGSIKDAWQRILGVMLGILFAWIVFELIGPGSVAIGIIIIASFYAGRRLGLEASGVQQLAVSTLLVVLGAAGTQIDNVAILHLANTLIGTGVGLLLNASVAPPITFQRPEKSWTSWDTGSERTWRHCATSSGQESSIRQRSQRSTRPDELPIRFTKPTQHCGMPKRV